MCDTQRSSQTTFCTSASEDLFGAPQFHCSPPNAWSGSATADKSLQFGPPIFYLFSNLELPLNLCVCRNYDME